MNIYIYIYIYIYMNIYIYVHNVILPIKYINSNSTHHYGRSCCSGQLSLSGRVRSLY